MGQFQNQTYFLPPIEICFKVSEPNEYIIYNQLRGDNDIHGSVSVVLVLSWKSNTVKFNIASETSSG